MNKDNFLKKRKKEILIGTVIAILSGTVGTCVYLDATKLDTESEKDVAIKDKENKGDKNEQLAAGSDKDTDKEKDTIDYKKADKDSSTSKKTSSSKKKEDSKESDSSTSNKKPSKPSGDTGSSQKPSKPDNKPSDGNGGNTGGSNGGNTGGGNSGNTGGNKPTGPTVKPTPPIPDTPIDTSNWWQGKSVAEIREKVTSAMVWENEVTGELYYGLNNLAFGWNQDGIAYGGLKLVKNPYNVAIDASFTGGRTNMHFGRTTFNMIWGVPSGTYNGLKDINLGDFTVKVPSKIWSTEEVNAIYSI